MSMKYFLRELKNHINNKYNYCNGMIDRQSDLIKLKEIKRKKETEIEILDKLIEKVEEF